MCIESNNKLVKITQKVLPNDIIDEKRSFVKYEVSKEQYLLHTFHNE